jgi:hypothetical protein
VVVISSLLKEENEFQKVEVIEKDYTLSEERISSGRELIIFSVSEFILEGKLISNLSYQFDNLSSYLLLCQTFKNLSFERPKKKKKVLLGSANWLLLIIGKSFMLNRAT